MASTFPSRSTRTGRSLALTGMALVAALGLAGVVQPVAAQTQSLTIVSDGSWLTSDTAMSGWTGLGFDDSSWSGARAPYPQPAYPALFDGSTALAIWHDPLALSDGTSGVNEAWFRRSFSLPSGATLSGELWIQVDDDFALYLNDQLVVLNQDLGYGSLNWHYDVTPYLQPGENVFAVQAVDGGWGLPFDRGYERLLLEAHVTAEVTPVPEPRSAALMFAGLLALAGLVRRSSRR